MYNSFSQKILPAAGPFGVRTGSVRAPFGLRSGSVRADFGPKFSDPKIHNFKIFDLCGRRRRGGGPQAALPSPAARRAPAAAATAAQIENFCEKFFKNSLSTKWRHYCDFNGLISKSRASVVHLAQAPEDQLGIHDNNRRSTWIA